MSLRALHGIAWLALAGGVVALARLATAPVVPVALLPSPAAPLVTPAPMRTYGADSLARVVVKRDLFRFGRRPAVVAYDPAQSGSPQQATQAPRPSLALVGLVAGTPPTAVVEGFPGVEGGRVVRVGDVVGSLEVVRIARDGVRIVGMDTVWVLRVRETWR